MMNKIYFSNSGNYRKAFFACRKHRIDLNFIVDHNPVKFIQDIPSFVDQIPEVDHINLFLTLVGCIPPSSAILLVVLIILYRRGPTSPEIITKICDAFLHDLEKRDLATYVNSILTAHVVKTPPDHESGLRLLLRLRGDYLERSNYDTSTDPLLSRFASRRGRRGSEIHNFPD